MLNQKVTIRNKALMFVNS